MGKDKNIQCIPENQTMGRENKGLRGRNRREGERMDTEREMAKILSSHFHWTSLFSSFMPFSRFFLGQRLPQQLFRTTTVEL